MRNLLAACLSIRNPERTFEQSDYYPFIQTLFKQDELWSLRDEIAVLTYNYDPYLDYLLARALEYRRTAAQNPVRLTELWNSVTGGYYAPDNLEWLTDQKRPATFCLLKLHGSICYARPGVKDDHQLRFTADVRTRISRISSLEELEQHPLRPPVLFPWEIINSDGEFVPGGASVPGETSLYDLNKLVWDRARREVQGATKVSFVGLSMHPFMNDGLKFL